MSTGLVYLVVMLDSVCTMLVVFATITGCAALISLIALGPITEADRSSVVDAWPKVKRFFYGFTISFVLITVALALVPSSRQAAAIYLVPKITNNERIHNISDKGLDTLEVLMDSYLEELSSKKGQKE